MSTPRQELQTITDMLASGERGVIAAIKTMSTHYKVDPSILPNEWVDLSAKQTVAHFGGYLVAHKGFSAEIVYSYATGIAKKSDKIDLSADTKAITEQLKSLDAKAKAEATEEESNNKELGVFGEKRTSSLLTGITELQKEVAKGTHLTRLSLQELATVVEKAQALLSEATVEPARVTSGVKVAS
jgi:hypothetical protein